MDDHRRNSNADGDALTRLRKRYAQVNYPSAASVQPNGLQTFDSVRHNNPNSGVAGSGRVIPPRNNIREKEKMKRLVIECMHGLGDNIFIRPLARAQLPIYDEVYLATPWPEVFEDLPFKFVRKQSQLRTQAKNMARQFVGRWVAEPKDCKHIKMGYGGALATKMPIPRILEHQLPLHSQPYQFDLGPYRWNGSWRHLGKPVAIIRPVTIRKEWTNTARNPLPEYIAAIVDRLKQTHHIICIADLQDKQEWSDGPLPFANEYKVHGEWDVKTLMLKMSQADIVVGGVGFIVPMAIAIGTPAFIILGGHGGHNAPEIITDPRMDLSKIFFARPDNFCPCTSMRHACNKTNTNLSQQWLQFISSGITPTLTCSHLVA